VQRQLQVLRVHAVVMMTAFEHLAHEIFFLETLCLYQPGMLERMGCCRLSTRKLRYLQKIQNPGFTLNNFKNWFLRLLDLKTLQYKAACH